MGKAIRPSAALLALMIEQYQRGAPLLTIASNVGHSLPWVRKQLELANAYDPEARFRGGRRSAARAEAFRLFGKKCLRCGGPRPLRSSLDPLRCYDCAIRPKDGRPYAPRPTQRRPISEAERRAICAAIRRGNPITWLGKRFRRSHGRLRAIADAAGLTISSAAGGRLRLRLTRDEARDV